jgi:aminodeoxyfutalosine synthase
MASPPSGFAAAHKTQTSHQTLPPLQIEPGMISDPALKPVAHKLVSGQRLDLQDGLALMNTTDLLGLGHMAHTARIAKNGMLTHYVINRHLNYSNICATQCAFCAFWRDESDEGAYLMDPSKPLGKAQGGHLMVDEVHIVGSCHPGLPLSYYQDLLRRAAETWPGATIKAFTAVEIAHIADSSGLGVIQVLERLSEAGLEAMTGGGAEIFSPRVREAICPEKISGQRYLEVSGQAHSMGIPSNATMLYGHIETAQGKGGASSGLARTAGQIRRFQRLHPPGFPPPKHQA